MGVIFCIGLDEIKKSNWLEVDTYQEARRGKEREKYSDGTRQTEIRRDRKTETTEGDRNREID